MERVEWAGRGREGLRKGDAQANGGGGLCRSGQGQARRNIYVCNLSSTSYYKGTTK